MLAMLAMFVRIVFMLCITLMSLREVLVYGAPPPPSPLQRISLPPGFQIEVYAARVPNARSLALGKNGTVFVGTQRAGRVYAVIDHDNDQRADEVVTLAEGLRMPNGVAFRNGALYVAEVNRVLRFDDIESHLKDPPAPTIVTDALPSGVSSTSQRTIPSVGQ